MKRSWLTSDQMVRLQKSGELPEEYGIRKAFTIASKALVGGDDSRVVRFTVTTNQVDRDRDVIDSAGWDVKDFNANPVIQWAHDYSQPPIGRSLALTMGASKMSSDIEFMPKELSPFADTIFRMVKGGWLNATSVGFKPEDWSYDEQRKGVNFAKQSLLEVSIVPVPANAGALVEARSAGVDVEPLREWAAKTLEAVGCAPTAVLDPAFLERFTALEASVNRSYSFAKASRKRECPAGEECMAGEGENGACGMGEECPMEEGKAAEAVLKLAEAVAKRGRVLSSANEGKLRQAHEKIGEVLALVAQAPVVEDAPKDAAAAIKAPPKVEKAYGGFETAGYTTPAQGSSAAIHVHDYSLYVYTRDGGQVVFDGGMAFQVADHSHRITAASLARGETEESDGHRHALMPAGSAAAPLPPAQSAGGGTDNDPALVVVAAPNEDHIIQLTADDVIDLDDIKAADGLEDISAAEFAATLREAIAVETRRAMNIARGRVD